MKNFYSKKNILSSCLSKSISIKLILDLLNIENKLYFGISKLSKNKKVAHAWLVDPVNGEFITPELDDMFPFLSQDKLEEIRKSSQDF